MGMNMMDYGMMTEMNIGWERAWIALIALIAEVATLEGVLETGLDLEISGDSTGQERHVLKHGLA